MNTATTSIATWSDATRASLQNAWGTFINVLPLLLAAIVVYFVGLLIAKAVSSLIRVVARRTRIDEYVERTGIPERIRQGGTPFSMSGFLASIGFWVVMLMTLTVIADTLRWATFGDFLRRIVAYTPNLIVGVAILVVGFIAARVAHDLVEGGVRAAGITDAAAETVATVARISIVVFATMAALTQIGIAPDLIKILFTGVVGAAAIGIGLAFGLGGRDKASELIRNISDGLRSEPRPVRRPIA
jgi:small-conductance mechanosensitive channel